MVGELNVFRFIDANVNLFTRRMKRYYLLYVEIIDFFKKGGIFVPVSETEKGNVFGIDNLQGIVNGLTW